MSRTFWIFGSLTLCAIAVAIAMAVRPARVPVEMATVARGTFTELVEEDGVTRVRDRYVVAAPLGGMLMRPSLRVGDRVRRDDVVAIIVPSPAQMLDARVRNELAARVEAAAAQAARARALSRQSDAAAVQADSEHQRLDELGSGGYASRTELERSALTLELRRKDAEAARFEAEAAAHSLEEARAALRESGSLPDGARARTAWSLRAPIDGTVLRMHQESEVVMPVGGPILEIGDLARLEARVDVLSTEATRIQPQAYVELDAGDVRLAGRVRRIEPAGYTKVSALGIEEQRVDVLVDLLPNPTALERVGDGFRVDAAIELVREENALLIPLSALFRQGEQWATYRIEDGRARLTPVRIGMRGADFATVTAGIAEGTAVVEYPSDAVHDGVRVSARR